MNEIQALGFVAEDAASKQDRALALNLDAGSGMGVTCAWCGDVIEEGPGPVSHGMCGICRLALLATVPDA